MITPSFTPSHLEIQDAYHFLFTIGVGEAARREILRESMVYASHRLHDYRDLEKARVLWALKSFRLGVSAAPAEASDEPREEGSRENPLECLPAKTRQLYAAHLFLDIDPAQLAEEAETSPAEVKDLLDSARSELSAKGFSSKTPQQSDSEVIDSGVRRKFEVLPIPAELAAELESVKHPSSGGSGPHNFLLRHPTLLAVGLSVLVLVVWGVASLVQFSQQPPGGETTLSLVQSIRETSQPPMEPVQVTAELLEDWFFLNHGLEQYRVPAELAPVMTESCRVFSHNGYPVAHVRFPEDDLDLLIFRPDHFGLTLARDRKWHLFPLEDLAVALQTDQDLGFLIIRPGSVGELEERMTN